MFRCLVIGRRTLPRSSRPARAWIRNGQSRREPNTRARAFSVTTPKYADGLSSLSKMSIVLDKAKNLAEKLQESAAYLNEEELNIKAEKHKIANPLALIEADLDLLNKNITSLISTQHPVLSTIAQYYFNLKGKRIRPVVILLLARALWHHTTDATQPLNGATEGVSQSQTRLAEIIEMIHTASLIHDDVIDEADTRRNTPSVNVAFGNKVAILAGDFLLARASISLAQLRSFEVTELMSRVISDLVEGEFMQMKAVKKSALDFEYYIQKTYYKTASLIANGCRSCAVLANLPRDIIESATEFGKHLGLAFQLIDDMLDFVGTADQLGKPSGQDLKLGLATAPCLYAAAEFPELTPLIERNFSNEGDPQKAFDLVNKSSGIQKTKQLAQDHIVIAINALSGVKDSPAKQALIALAETVLTRTK